MPSRAVAVARAFLQSIDKTEDVVAVAGHGGASIFLFAVIVEEAEINLRCMMRPDSELDACF